MEVSLVQWLPPSSESRQFLKFSLITVVLAAVLIAAGHYAWSRHASRLVAQAALEGQADAVAWMLDKNPELDRTHGLLVHLAASSLAAGTPVEGFIVAGEEEVRASARPEDEKTPWEQVRERLWPGMLLAATTLHRDPSRPEKETGKLYLAAPGPPPPSPAWSVLMGLGGGVVIGLILTPLLAMLVRHWFIPLHRIVEANRSSMGGQNAYLMVPSAVAPPGEIREIVFHRNHILETLKAREETLARRTRDMEVFSEFGKQLLAARDTHEVPGLILGFLAQGVSCDVAVVLIQNEETHRLHLRSRMPLSELAQAEAERLAVTAYYERSFVQLAGEKLDVQLHVVDPRAEAFDGGFRTAVWAPITTEAKPLGVLGFLSAAERQVGGESSRLINFIALAAALSFKRLHGSRVERPG